MRFVGALAEVHLDAAQLWVVARDVLEVATIEIAVKLPVDLIEKVHVELRSDIRGTGVGWRE